MKKIFAYNSTRHKMLMFLFMLRFIAAQPTLKSIDLGSVYQNESVKAD